MFYLSLINKDKLKLIIFIKKNCIKIISLLLPIVKCFFHYSMRYYILSESNTWKTLFCVNGI